MRAFCKDFALSFGSQQTSFCFEFCVICGNFQSSKKNWRIHTGGCWLCVAEPKKSEENYKNDSGIRFGGSGTSVVRSRVVRVVMAKRPRMAK